MKRLLFAALALGALTSAALAGSALPTADGARPVALTDRQLDQVAAGDRPEIAGAACFVPCATIGRFAPIAEEAEPEAVALPPQTIR
jgi:hypothetical protein